MTDISSKKKAVLERIERLEDAIAKGREFLKNGDHADWSGFRPLFVTKLRNGRTLPPHKDWVKSTFLPRREKALRKAEKALERLAQSERTLDRRSGG